MTHLVRPDASWSLDTMLGLRGRLAYIECDAASRTRLSMASDSAGVLETAPPADPRPLPRSRPKGPARPVLEGVGLDAPFFDDKNRAFWVLQSTGWTGYFIL